jgi:hypothetical protein
LRREEKTSAKQEIFLQSSSLFPLIWSTELCAGACSS